MRADVDLTNFTAGELSPRMRARVDVSKYWNGCESLLNFVVQPQGGVTRRPGTLYINKVADQTNPPRLIPFTFSTVQAYALEFGTNSIRVYRNDGTVVSGGSPVTIATPYGAADVGGLKYTQSADTLYLFHPSYPTQALTRTSDTSWTLSAVTFRDGPYLDVNGTATTLTVGTPGSAAGSSITLTASATTGINGGAGFVASDVGRFVRLKLLAVWTWATITAVTSTTEVTATLGATVPNGAFGGLDGQPWAALETYPLGAVVKNGSNYYQVVTAGTSAASGGPSGTTNPSDDGTVVWDYVASAPPTATAAWQLGKWSATTGYGWVGCFWQSRLFAGATNNQPNAIEGSVTSDFVTFAPTLADGTVVDNGGLSWIIEDDEVNAIRWLSVAGSAQAMQLGIGTTGSEQILQAANTALALTPTSVQAYRETYYGSAPNVRPLRIGKSVLFVDRPGQQLREWTFQWMVNGYLGPPLSTLSEHLLRAGVTDMDWAQDPLGVVWMISGGVLIGMTYLREQDVVAFHRHQLGGQYYGAPPIVESLCVIPSADQTYDELWLAVLRTVNGTPTRTIEAMRNFFQTDKAEDGWFVDCGLQTTLQTPAGAAVAFDLTTSEAIDAGPSFAGTGEVGFTENQALATGGILRFNDGVLQVTGTATAKAAAVAVLQPLSGLVAVPSGAWTYGPILTTLSGLDHLTGERVAVLGDGMSYGTQTVVGGAVTLSPGASLVTAGLPYTSALVSMPLEPAARAQQSAAGKTKRIDTLYLRFDATVGGSCGLRMQDPYTDATIDELDPIESRNAADPMSAALPPFTGVRRVFPKGDPDFEGRLIVAQTEPLPMTILAAGARLVFGDGDA